MGDALWGSPARTNCSPQFGGVYGDGCVGLVGQIAAPEVIDG